MATATADPVSPKSRQAVGCLLGPGSGRVHDRGTTLAIAERIAGLLELPFCGEPAKGAPVYLVPDDTIVGLESASAFGIEGKDDLFGGVVPHPFIATKAITHPLIDEQAVAPEGWVATFAPAVGGAALRGFAAFSAEDAWRAASALLKQGAARLKPGGGRGGRGQVVLHSEADAARAIADLDSATLAAGVVLEENLRDVGTFSIGYLDVAGMRIGYCGTQVTMRDNSGRSVYGGSDLTFVRGNEDALVARPWSAEARTAIRQARQYDAAALRLFPGLIASRRNYDVAVGVGHDGRRRSGVLEQSWRIGGATPAEILALEAFRGDPRLEVTRACAVERYGKVAVPDNAAVFFSGDDPDAGPLTKYARMLPVGRL